MTSLFDIFDGAEDPKPASSELTPPAAPSAPPPSHEPQPPKPEPRPRAFGHGLSDETVQAARAAAEAVDAETAARAALDARKDVLQAKLEQELADLSKAYNDAKIKRSEAEALLLKVMGVEKITRIPMDDRPDIQIKVTPGKKQNITKTWLDDPEGVVVKTYGPAAPDVIWNAVPKGKPKTDVIVPAKYDDEPDR